MPGLPVHHSLPQFTQTHVHWVGDGIQPTHPLSSASPPAFNLSQNQGLFQWVGSLHQVAKVLEFQLQHQSFQWTFRMFTVRTVQNTNSTPVLGHVFLVVQLLGHFRLFVIWRLYQTRLFCSPLSLSLLKLMPVRKVMPSLHPILWHPILLLPSFFPGIEFFSNKLALIRWPRDWSFRFTISPFNEYSGLVSFKIDWFDLLAVQGSSRVFSSTIVRKYQFFGAQPSLSSSHHMIFLLSHPFMTTGKTIGLTWWVFVSKATSLPLNALSKFVLPLFPWSKRLLNSWLQSPSAGILEPMKIKSVTASTPSPF